MSEVTWGIMSIFIGTDILADLHFCSAECNPITMGKQGNRLRASIDLQGEFWGSGI